MIKQMEPAVAALTFRPRSAPAVSITLRASESGLTCAELTRARAAAVRPSRQRPSCAVLDQAVDELEAYFDGSLREFTVPLHLEGQGSDFDVAVWEELAQVPFGSCLSYAELARRIGRPGAARAVGGAVGRNPIPILIPCHRVIGSGGRLTGFSCGLDLKILLLEHEGISMSPARQPANRLVLAVERGDRAPLR